MRLVREHINEKFTEDSDPIHDMGIGFFNKNFTNEKEFYKFLIEHLPYILGTEKIPDNILNSNDQWLKPKYFFAINRFFKKYKIKFKNVFIKGKGDEDCPVYSWPMYLNEILSKKGYKD
jgi:hypothetical protein